MGMNTKDWLMGGFVFISLVLAFVFWTVMPDEMITHWGPSGKPDGYGPKWMGLLLMPAVLLLVYMLYFLIPRIDPLKRNIEKFFDYYQNLILVLMGFVLYLYVVSILLNLGYGFSINLFLFPGLSALFYYLGVVLEKAKRNWFVGIRTPWTLSSDRVWKKTHKKGSIIFKILAVVMLAGLVYEDVFLIVVIPVLTGTVYLFVYSYYEYRKEER